MSAYFSIVVPVYRTDPGYLAQMIDSVQAQTDDDWELLLIDDGSQDSGLSAALRAAAAADQRIVTDELPGNSGIVAATDRGLSWASGEFVCLLDHDDVLTPDALATVRAAIDERPDADVLYSDETIVGPLGEVLGEFTKPVFSPERLRGQMYTGHLATYRRSLLERVGGMREGFDGSQDYDLVLRATELAREVVHIPTSLYRWRTLPTSVSHTVDNQYVFDAAQQALTEHLGRRGTAAEVIQTDSTGRYRIDRALPAGCSVAVLIPVAGTRSFTDGRLTTAVLQAVSGVQAGIGALEPQVVVLADSRVKQQVLDEIADLMPADRLTVLHRSRFGTSAAVNRAVLALGVSHLVLLAEDAVPHTPGWLDRLVSLAADEQIGVVAPRLINGDGLLLGAGLSFRDGLPRVIAAGVGSDDAGPFGALQINREVTAPNMEVVAIAVDLLLNVGGFSQLLQLSGAVVDVALKAAESGRRAVVSADVDVIIDRDPRLPDELDLRLLHARWGRYLKADRYWPY